MLPYAYIILGFLFLSIAAILFFTDYKQTKAWVQTTGLVIEFYRSPGPSASTITPVVQFKDITNKEWKAKGNVMMSGALYAKGENINIFYNPKNPTEIVINNIYYRFLGIFLFTLGGLIFSCMGLIGLCKG